MIEQVVVDGVMAFISVFGVIGFLFCIIFWRLWRESKDKIIHWEKEYNHILSLKKSSEVRLGKTAEHLAPFIKEWPYDPERFTFIGCPVDGISINDDSIVFVEIKTGKARLTKSQKHAKQLIKEGKVRFETFRISEDGVSIHREEMIKYEKGDHECRCPNKDVCGGIG